jgi:hypothetical protein
MAQIFNQYSLVLFILFILTAIILVLRRKPGKSILPLAGVFVLGAVIAWIFLHPVQTPLMDNAEKVQAVIGSGTPVLLEFQSPY